MEGNYIVKTNITHLINEVGDKTTVLNQLKLTIMFNTFFSNIGQKLAANTEKS